MYIIKTNAQLHLKVLSCNFYFLKNLTDIRHIILQPARKFKNSFMEGILPIKHFFPSSISFLPNPIFLLLSFIFRFVNILGTHNLQKEYWQNQSRSDGATGGVLLEKMFLKISQYSQENIWIRVSFLKKGIKNQWIQYAALWYSMYICPVAKCLIYFYLQFPMTQIVF